MKHPLQIHRITDDHAESNRLISIDIWRGINIMFVISSHLFFGLFGGNSASLDAMASDPFSLFFTLFSSVGQMFFFLSGISQVLSMEKQLKKGVEISTIVKRECKKGIFLLILGEIYDPIVYWHFGLVDTLQIIGISYIIIALLYMPVMARYRNGRSLDARRLKRAGTRFLWGMIAVLIASPLVRLLVGYPIYDPSVEPLILCIPPTNFIEDVQAWLTTSFFPIFPCIAYFFSGAWIGTRILVANDAGDMAKRKLNRFLMIIGVVFMILGAIDIVLGGAPFPTALYPDNWFDIETEFNIQPLTTFAFLFYLGMSMFAVGFFSLVYEVQHSPKWQSRITRIHYGLNLDLIFNTWVRFSYYSLTIYVIQYAWIPILRVLQLATGEPFLYTMLDTLRITVLIVVAWVLFAYLAKGLNTSRGQKFTIERLLKKITS